MNSCHSGLVVADQAAVGDGDPVGEAAEMGQGMFGRAERWPGCWNHGGPYDAREEMQDAFDLPEDMLENAVREVQSSGTYEWAAGDWWNDLDGGPDDGEAEGIFSIDEPLSDISNFDFVEEHDDAEHDEGDVTPVKPKVTPTIRPLASAKAAISSHSATVKKIGFSQMPRQ